MVNWFSVLGLLLVFTNVHKRSLAVNVKVILVVKINLKAWIVVQDQHLTGNVKEVLLDLGPLQGHLESEQIVVGGLLLLDTCGIFP